MSDTEPDLSVGELVELVAAYVETAFKALDDGNPGVARAALRRISQFTLELHGKVAA